MDVKKYTGDEGRASMRDWRWALLFSGCAVGGTVAMFSSHGLGSYDTTPWDELLVWGGWGLMFFGLCGWAGIAFEMILREIRDIWHEKDEEQDSPRRRRGRVQRS